MVVVVVVDVSVMVIDRGPIGHCWVMIVFGWKDRMWCWSRKSRVWWVFSGSNLCCWMLGLVWWAGCVCWLSRFGRGFVDWLLVLFCGCLGTGYSVRKPGLGARIRPYHQYEMVMVLERTRNKKKKDDISRKGNL